MFSKRDEMSKKTMTTDKAAFVRRRVEAASATLLVNRRPKLGAAMLGREPLDFNKRVNLAHMAGPSDTDPVYMQFADTKAGYRMTGISIVMPRDNNWHSHAGYRR